MHQPSISLAFLLVVLMGCALLAVDAELSPFYNFRSASNDNDNNTGNTNVHSNKNSNGIKINKNPNGSTEPRRNPTVRSRNLGTGRKHHGHGHSHVPNYKYGHGGHGDDGHNHYTYTECESFYSKSHKKDSKKYKKQHKKEKHYKSDKKKCKNFTTKPTLDDHDDTGNGNGNNPVHKQPDRAYKDFLRFIMVRDEAGTPVPGNFGVGDTLALNGKIFYWEDYEDNLMSNVPVGTFVTLCTGISKEGDDLMCTYEVVLGLPTDRDQSKNDRNGNAGSTGSAIGSVGAFVANGPNYVSENHMIVTGTEFDFAEYRSGTMVTTEDLINPYLYADLYLV